jgi:hypothetical protein
MFLSSIALVAGGVAIVLVSAYLWRHPEQYYRYLHGTSPLNALNVRPPRQAVTLGAVAGVVIGLAVAAWGIIQLLVS